jgi:hypothetical protein
MRRLFIVALALVAVVAAAVGVSLIWLEPDDLRAPLETRLSDALGRPVALGPLSLALWPLPALEVKDVRIGGKTPQSPPLAEISALRLRLSLLPLLVGRVVLGAVELERPVVRLDVDRTSRPVFPVPAPAGAEPGESPASEPAGAGGPLLAVDSIRIREGSVSAGPWQVDNLSLDGKLSADGSARLRADADLPKLGKLRNLNANIQGIGADALSVQAQGELREGDVGGLAGLAGLPPAGGTLAGSFELALDAGKLTSVALDLAGSDLVIRSGSLYLEGGAALEAELPGSFALDLERADLVMGGTFHKARGVPGRIEGRAAGLLPPRKLEGVRVRLAGVELPLEVDLDSGAADVKSARIELEELAPLVEHALPPLGGALALEPLHLGLSPLSISGSVGLDAVSIELEHGKPELSGSLRGEGRRVVAEKLALSIGGQTLDLRASYELPTDELRARLEANGVDFEPLLAALSGHHEVTGRLTSHFDLEMARLAGEGRPYVGGKGRLELRDGRIRGVSLLRQVVGELAVVPVLAAAVREGDPSAYDEEEFESLTSDFQLVNQRLETQNLELVYRKGTLYLAGWINVLAGTLSMSGRVELARGVDEQGAARRPLVIPISSLSGTVSDPRVRLDARALAGVFAGAASGGPVREKLEERIGKEGADLVEGLLRGLGAPAKPKEPGAEEEPR